MFTPSIYRIKLLGLLYVTLSNSSLPIAIAAIRSYDIRCDIVAGQVVRWTHGQMIRWSGGQVDICTLG